MEPMESTVHTHNTLLLGPGLSGSLQQECHGKCREQERALGRRVQLLLWGVAGDVLGFEGSWDRERHG